MTEFFDNGIVQFVLAVFAAVAVLAPFGWLKFRRDEKIVAEFLKSAGLDERKRFSTTVDISSATRLHEDRVRSVCNKSNRIKQKQEDDDAWKWHE